MSVQAVKSDSGESNRAILLSGVGAPGANAELDTGTYAPGSIFVEQDTGVIYVLGSDGSTWNSNAA